MTLYKILLICLCLTAGWVDGHACNCLEVPSVHESLKQSDIVITGIVLSVAYTSQYDSLGLFTNPKSVASTFQDLGIISALVKLKVEFVYNGWVYTNVINILTPSDEAACGFNFHVGQKYIVYAWITDEEQAARHERHSTYDQIIFSTGLCTRTQAWNITEHDEILKAKGN